MFHTFFIVVLLSCYTNNAMQYQSNLQDYKKAINSCQLTELNLLMTSEQVKNNIIEFTQLGLENRDCALGIFKILAQKIGGVTPLAQEFNSTNKQGTHFLHACNKNPQVLRWFTHESQPSSPSQK